MPFKFNPLTGKLDLVNSSLSIEGGGVAVPQEPILNFIGNNLQVVDNPGNTSTDVNVVAGGSDGQVQFNNSSGTPYIDGSDTIFLDYANKRAAFGGSVTPTARIHIKAGSATANTAPLKFSTGTNLTSPEAGAMEWNGTNLFITASSTRQTLAYLASLVEFVTETNVTATSGTMTVNTIHRANNASQVALTLPTTIAVGSKFRVVGVGAGGWRIAQNSSQLIIWDAGGVAGTNQTTTGTGGRLDSSDQYDMVEMECITADTTLIVTASKGNITLT